MSRYPMDITELKLGDTIAPATIERVMGVKTDSPQFWRAKLQLQTFLERAWLDERGFRITIRHRGDAMIILDHSDASRENPRRFRQALAQMSRAHRRNLDVNTTDFEDADKLRHARNLEVDSKTLAAAMRARRDAIMPAPVTRDQLPPAADKK